MSCSHHTLECLTTLRESWDFEAKLAAGRDGRGQLPESFWETYSAMANTEGGVIVLGLRELSDHSLEVAGLLDPERVEEELWAALNNRQKVSVNLLTRDSVQTLTIGGRKVLRIDVPRASRQQRPVYVNGDVLGGTYLRFNASDHHADPEWVRRTVADAEVDEIEWSRNGE